MITVEELRTKYTRIAKSTYRRSDGPMCCVGGALCREMGSLQSFPTEQYLVTHLRKVNANLSVVQATNYAARIIWHNDDGDFDNAWDALDEALTYGEAV